jgi:molybdopterin synthase catalytic subunit
MAALPPRDRIAISSGNTSRMVAPHDRWTVREAADATRVNNGPMGEIRLVDVGEQPITARDLETLVADARAGAIVSFSGNVRDHDHGRSVATLTYEGHPSAAAVLAEVAKEIDDRFDLVALAVAHRVGPIPIGEAALVAAVATAHRGEAFAACQALVDLVKERLPVWKHQVFTDGTDEWVNCA